MCLRTGRYALIINDRASKKGPQDINVRKCTEKGYSRKKQPMQDEETQATKWNGTDSKTDGLSPTQWQRKSIQQAPNATHKTYKLLFLF